MQNMSVLIWLLVFSLFGVVYTECDANTGPAGSPECVLLEPDYHKYQWGTCLTDTYISTFSKGRHECKDRSATYCYYQCMIEIHDDGGSGPVFDDCACGRDAPINFTTPVPVSTSSIPDWCFSPSGTECSWYRSCLEVRYPCNQEHNSYALDYAKKFCNLYTNNYEHFNDKGQQWIDAVRKCLQVNLVPILRPFVHKTCDEIKEMAFDSHPGCYVSPDASKQSICDIGVKNMWWVFWTVKGAIRDAPVDTFTQLLDVAHRCSWDKTLFEIGITALEFAMPEVRVVAEAVKAVGTLISAQRQWDERGLSFFAFSKTSGNYREKRSETIQNAMGITYVNILLASKAEYDLNAANAPAVNATEEAQQIAKAMGSGTLTLDLPDGMTVTALNVCGDYECTETILNVSVPEIHHPKTSSTAISTEIHHPKTSSTAISTEIHHPKTSSTAISTEIHHPKTSSTAISKTYMGLFLTVVIVFGTLEASQM